MGRVAGCVFGYGLIRAGSDLSPQIVPGRWGGPRSRVACSDAWTFCANPCRAPEMRMGREGLGARSGAARGNREWRPTTISSTGALGTHAERERERGRDPKLLQTGMRYTRTPKDSGPDLRSHMFTRSVSKLGVNQSRSPNYLSNPSHLPKCGRTRRLRSNSEQF